METRGMRAEMAGAATLDGSSIAQRLVAVLPLEGDWKTRAEAVLGAGAVACLDASDAEGLRRAAAGFEVHSGGRVWLRAPASAAAELAAATQGRLPSVLLRAEADVEGPLDALRRLRASRPEAALGLEATSALEAEAAEAAGADFVVVRGLEAGGWISEESTSVLVRHARGATTLPVIAWGAAGPDSTAALLCLGAAGVVFADPLMLATDAPSGELLRRLLERFDPRDTAQLGRLFGRRFRVYAQLGTRPVRNLLARERELLEQGGAAESLWAALQAEAARGAADADPRSRLVPLGQEAVFAAPLAEEFGSSAGILEGVARRTAEILEGLARDFPLAPGQGISRFNRTALPLHQGPMAQTSDTPAFARAVVERGALPWLALGNMPPHVAEETIHKTSELLQGRPFGAGIIGLDANYFRDRHIELLGRLKPPYALVAAGTAEQALTIEKLGITTYLHTPTPELIRGALKAGCRRLILEGAEAGGHIGELGGLVLWQAATLEVLRALDEGIAAPAELAIVPAGGIGDEASAAAAAAVMWRLHRRGVAVGLQMGTAYLLTQDILDSGALSKGFQRCALEVGKTILMGESVKTPTRVLDTPQAKRVLAKEAEREVQGVKLHERKHAYEQDNLGGLRAAAKAQRIAKVDKETGAVFETLSDGEQRDKGLFHAGQGVALAKEAYTIAQLHERVTDGAKAQIRETLLEVRGALPIRSRPPAQAPVAAGQIAVDREPIAIIGMGAIVPGALSARQFWDNMLAGKSAIAEVPKDRWDPALYWDADPGAPDKTYSKIGGFVTGFRFDRKAFRLPPAVVDSLDLAQRMALEASRQALEDAGYLSGREFDRERCAIILGNAMGGDLRDATNLRLHFPQFAQVLRQVLAEAGVPGADADRIVGGVERRMKAQLPQVTEDSMPGELGNVIAGRIAAAFDLAGPSYVTDAACASSLAALEASMRGLRDRRFDLAVSGGVEANMGAPAYVKFSKLGALSAEHSAPFDARANGFVMGEGACAFLLKRLSDAQRDGDKIYAVLRGVGASSDGKGKGITAPNPVGQKLAVQRALQDAGVDPSTIGLIEAHGTGTPVGDRTEVAVLREMYGRASANGGSVALGSVKSMIGHLKAAAGAAGVLKAALAIHHGVIPPSLNFKTPNPELDLERTPFRVPVQPLAWESPDRPRRAAVSSFGFGGTNFHLILEEPPGRVPAAASRPPSAAPAAAATLDQPAAEPVAAAAAASPKAQGMNDQQIYKTLVEVLCERTGYDPAEIEPDFELEADLGIDTVKQAEIMASVRERYGLARDEGFRLAEYPSLKAMAGYVLARLAMQSPAPAQPASAQASAKSSQSPAQPQRPSPTAPLARGAEGPEPPKAEVEASTSARPSAFGQPAAEPVHTAAGFSDLPPQRVGKVPGISTPPADREAIYKTLVEVLCERTGYDPAEIEPDFELEADLGIDTVKQAEIMASVRERYGLARDEGFRLADYPSLNAMAGYVAARLAQAPAAPPVLPPQPEKASDPSGREERERTPEKTGDRRREAEGRTQSQPAAAPRLASSLTTTASDEPTNLPGPVLQTSELTPDGPHAEFLPLLLTAPDGPALLAAVRSALAALRKDGPAALRSLRQRSTVSQPGRLRLGTAAADPDTALRLLEAAAQALETGKGSRLLENKGVFLREAPQPGKIAFLFPGQGSQYVGMLADLRERFPAVAATLEEADEVLLPALGRALSSYMMPGSSEGFATTGDRTAEEALKQTAVTQPAMLAADIALFRLLEQFGVRPDLVAGHSLGEYGACVASGMMSFADGLRTVSTRGTEMARATPLGGDCGLMAAVPASAARVEAVLARCSGYVVAANKNSPGQTVIAGSTPGVRQAIELLAQEGLECQLIPVSHAFHSKIVSAASEPLRRHLQGIRLSAPRVRTLTNVTGDYFPADVARIVDLLAVQLASPVEFVKLIERMHKDGANTFVEVGPKRAQAGFVSAILEGRPHRAYCSNHPKLGGLQSLRELLSALAADGLVLQAGLAQAPRAEAVRPDPRPESLAPRAPKARGGEDTPLVVSGLALVLPGMPQAFGKDDAFAWILSGHNLIQPIPAAARQAILDKSIQRLMKRPDGSGELVTASSVQDVPKLAGVVGEFDLASEFGVPAETIEALDKASQLALGAGLDALRDAGIPLVPDYQVTRSGKRLRTGWRLPAGLGDRTGIVYASVFAGMDLLAEDVARYARAAEGERPAFNRKFMLRILGLGHTQLAEFIGARGPSTRISSACASTTTAIALAEDWIRLGRADRVIVLGADDVTSTALLEWIGAGMFAAGALTTEEDVTQAALPFDRRRHGTILGAGAVALVIERNADVEGRGYEPIADILATRFANSAYHATRLDVEHVAAEVEAVIAEAERRWGVERRAIAARTVFMSHETYTPAQGGSASAEIAALRRTFGEAADQVVIANTKGFTGHAMGAGLEDAVVLKALQRQALPPIANFREPDPELGNLRLSPGGPHELDYALRLGAGFGSQLALALFRARAKQEDRLLWPEAYRRWVGRLIGQDEGDVEIEQRVLRVAGADPGPGPAIAPQVEPGRAQVLSAVAGPPGMSADAVPGTLEPTSDPSSAAGPRCRSVVLEPASEPRWDRAAAAALFGGRRVAVAGGPDSLALELCGLIEAHGGQALRDRLDAPVHALISLIGCGPARDEVELEQWALRAFALARDWRRQAGDAEGSGRFFASVSARGSLLAGAAAGLTKSLGRGWSGLRVRCIEIETASIDARRILAEIVAEPGAAESVLEAGRRLVVQERPVQPAPARSVRLDSGSVVILTGGGRGITARVALDLARRYRCRLALVGRTEQTERDPLSVDLKTARDRARSAIAARGERVTPVALERELAPLERQREVALTLRQLEEAGSEAMYLACDLADRGAVAAMLDAVRRRFGRIDGVIHGAGVEISRRIEEKTDEEIRGVFRGKALGGLHLASLMHASELRFFVAFTSIAGRYGNAGQADYSAANEVLVRLVQGLGAVGRTLALALDWSAWDEVGMASRGSMRQILSGRGVELLRPEQAAPRVAELLEAGVCGEVVIAGALGALGPDSAAIAGGTSTAAEAGSTEAHRAAESRQPVPQRPRMESALLDEILTHEPGHFLEARRTLDLERDAFLRDHVYEGVPLMPGVMAIEMFAEAALRLFPGLHFAGADEVEFLQALKIHRGEPVPVLVRATAFENGAPRGQRRVEAVVLTRRTTALGRTVETLHFRGVVRLAQEPLEEPVPLRIDPSEPLWEGPDRERIYKQMFHTGLFRVLDGVPYVGGDTIVAYGGRPEGDLTKGAPGVELQTDPLVTEMAFQAAGLWGMIERGQSLLPLSIGRLRYFEGLGAGGGPVVLRVRVRQADDKGLCVDAEVRAADGRLLQALEEYRMVAHRAVPAAERLERGARWQLRRMSLSAREIGGWLHRLGKPGLEILTQAEQGQGTRFRRQQHRDEWLASRLAAKLLCRDYLRDFWGLSLPLGQIEIAHRIGGEPFARLVVGPRPLPDEDVALPPLSLSHSDGRAVVVLASPGYRLRPGVDLERVEPRSEAFVQSYFHTDELSLAVPGALRRDEKVTALWTIKEAVSKALGTGLRASTFEVLVRAIEPDGWARVELLGKAAQAFGELLGTELRVRVSLEFGFVTAEAYLLCRDGAGPTAAPEPSGLAAAAALLYHKGLI